jgi:zinc/manganese transport system substrate-binding protein
MLATAFTTLFVVPLAVGPAIAQQSQPRLKAIATFSILGDFVKNVGGDRIEVGILVGANGNALRAQTSPADARRWPRPISCS